MRAQRAGSQPAAAPAAASAMNERPMRARAGSIKGVLTHLATTTPAPETKKAAAAPVPKQMTMAERNEARYQELLAARQRRGAPEPAPLLIVQICRIAALAADPGRGRRRRRVRVAEKRQQQRRGWWRFR